MNIPSTLVIGADGFIGKAVVNALNAHDSTRVRAGSRRTTADTKLIPSGATVVSCDLTNPASVRDAMANQSVVIHCARDATNEPGAEPVGLSAVIASGKQSGVTKLIYLSSIAVYGNVSGVISEKSPWSSKSWPYGMSKRRAEQICEAASANDFRVVVLRPTLVYGPSGEEWTVRYMKDLIAGRLTKLGDAGESRANLVSVDDLAKFCVRLAVQDLEPFTVLNINGDEPPTFNEYFQLMSSALGFGRLSEPSHRHYHEVRRRFRKVVRVALRVQNAALPKTLSDTPLGRLRKQLEERYAFNHFDQSLNKTRTDVMFSNEAAKKNGFVPQTSLNDGLRAVADWARNEGMIPLNYHNSRS